MGKKISLWTRLSYLSIDLSVLGCNIDLHPFVWVKPKLKTHTRPLAHTSRSFQFFGGPFHIWRFAGERGISVRLEITMTGNPFGQYPVTGDDALPFLWRWATGKQPWIPTKETTKATIN